MSQRRPVELGRRLASQELYVRASEGEGDLIDLVTQGQRETALPANIDHPLMHPPGPGASGHLPRCSHDLGEVLLASGTARHQELVCGHARGQRIEGVNRLSTGSHVQQGMSSGGRSLQARDLGALLIAQPSQQRVDVRAQGWGQCPQHGALRLHAAHRWSHREH